jgi:hypothetical protein
MRALLKVTILRGFRTQRHFSRATGIREDRLSSIIQGWADPSDSEKDTIATALKRHSTSDLFRDDAATFAGGYETGDAA